MAGFALLDLWLAGVWVGWLLGGAFLLVGVEHEVVDGFVGGGVAELGGGVAAEGFDDFLEWGAEVVVDGPEKSGEA